MANDLKTKRYFLSISNKNTIPANTSETELLSIMNTTNTEVKSKGIKIVYKDIDQSDCIISCDLQSRRSNPIFQGENTLGNLGQLLANNQAHEFIPFANAMELKPNQVVKFKITTFSKAINPRDINISLMVEEA